MTPLWNHRPLREPPKPGWGLTDQKTKLPKCKNAALRQPLPSFLLKARPQRPTTDFGYSEGSVSGVCQWQEAGFSRATGYHGRHAEASPVRPRIVTVVRPCGKEGVRKISLLLNRRAVQTFEQLMADISEALGLPCWNNARLRRLFSPMGREIHGLADFFRFDNAFLGFGNNRPTLNEVQAALEELYPGNPSYCEHLMKLWDRILRPKATKADSGFHDDDPGAEKSLEAAPDQQVNQPSVNNLQPVGVKNNQKVERQFWKKKNELQKEDKKEPKREDKKKPIYCRNCRGHGPPLPPIKSGKNTGSQSNINSSGNPQSQKTEKNDAKPNTSPRTTHRSTQETRSSTPAQLMRKKDICSYLLPDGAEVTFEDIERCYEMGRVVGDGNFAVVRECRVRGLAEMFAMKIVDSAKLQGRGHMIKNEIALLQRLEHPRLIRLFRSHHTNIHVYILMELVSGGDLFDAISQSGRFSERSSACMIRDVSQALEYIHSKSIAHRDIKPENLLVQRHSNGTLNLKLADFGLAMVITEPVFTVCGTPTYVAPEILAETGYGVEVDVWAMGVILFVLLSGFPPFRSADRNQEELFRLIQKGELLFLSPYWDKVSEGAKSLVRALLEIDPKMRLSATETLQDVWLQQAAAQKDQRSAGKDLADRKDQQKPSRESLKADKMPENGTTKYERNNNGQEREHLNHHRQHKTSFPQDTTIRK